MTGSNRRGLRLYRSRDDSVIFGVCGGLGEFFDLNPWGVRLVWVLMSIPALPAVLAAYVVLAVLMKPAPAHRAAWAAKDTGQDDNWFEAPPTHGEVLRRLTERATALDGRIRRMESIVTRPGFGQ
ncbi:MAG: PspC domain-containing protein [Candidatus Sumerlaeaceae bacterium]|nr:PspC domain-containing protein [Candidatus Sumerlaeaceae bacterium]